MPSPTNNDPRLGKIPQPLVDPLLPGFPLRLRHCGDYSQEFLRSSHKTVENPPLYANNSNRMDAHFSQQQISGINHYFSKIADGSFDEDDIRLLLLHLREYLRSRKGSTSDDEKILIELGDFIAHGTRDKGMLHKRIVEVMQRFSSPNCWDSHILSIFDSDEVISVFKKTLLSSGVLMPSTDVKAAFATHHLDLTLCLMTMLDGVIFSIPFSRHKLVNALGQNLPINVRVEMEFAFLSSHQEVRLAALIPMMDRGGVRPQCILRCTVPNADKIHESVGKRVYSSHGYCSAIKCIRDNGELKITAINPAIKPVDFYKIVIDHGYDTHPLATNIPVTVLGQISP
jgi:hypothetical protein